MIEKLGLQAYTCRSTMEDAEGVRTTFQKIAAAGYDNIQTAGCKIPYAEYKQYADEAGLTICGTHENFNNMIQDPEAAMENHRILGTTNIGIGGYSAEDLDGIKKFIRDVNAFADKIAQHGFKFTFHNHQREFRRFDGKLWIDYLIDGFDPDTTSFVLDTYWVQEGGADIRHMMERLAGRIDILHLKDMKVLPDKTHTICEIGEGNLWWDGIIKTAEDIGVKYYVVEQDHCDGDPFDSIRISADYLKRYQK